MKRETKLCHICNGTIYRAKYTSDYNWNATKNCSQICANLSSAIIKLKEIGYKVEKPH